MDEAFNVSVTENMAKGYRTTGKNLLDMNFAVVSLRNRSEQEIIKMFIKAYFDDKKAAMVWLFFARDIRGGLGERRLFRVLFRYLAENMDNMPISRLIELIPEYGRFDDMLLLLETAHADKLVAYISRQLQSDLDAMERGESVSLLAKWLPSVNTSSPETKRRGKMIAKALLMTDREYRKTLARLRAYIDVVECKMSAKRFNEIDYVNVPSRAHMIYRDAFMRHDEDRRIAYLSSLKRGEVKINASVLYPHEIVHEYDSGEQLKPYDETLEQLWKNMPDISLPDNTIVVADGSGSMQAPVGPTGCSALSVANALAIYFAEKSTGYFKDRYITFSQSPQLVDLSKGKTLKEKLQIAYAYNEVSDTDIYKVFKLILHNAQENNITQADLPKNIVIISDMEFNACAVNADERLFSRIKTEYEQSGYALPRLIFWNVCARTDTIPIKDNELGVALVSGFSVSIVKMIMSTELDPYKCLLEILNDERYDAIRAAVNEIE